MKASLFPTVPILAVLAVPFGLAVYDDAKHPNRGADLYGPVGLGFRDEADYAADYDRDYEYEYDKYNREWEEEEEEQEPSTMGDDFFQQVFFMEEGRARPALAGALAELKFGNPRIDDDSHPLTRWSDYGESPYEGATLYLGYHDNRLVDVTVSFRDDGTALRRFETRWGEPGGRSDSYGTKTALWINPQQHVAAVVESDEYSARVVFSRYLPLEELVAPGKKKGLGIVDARLLGAKRDKVLDALSEYIDPYEADEYSAYAMLPRTEYAAGSTTGLSLEFQDGKVSAYELSVDFVFNPNAEDELVELYAKKLGRKPIEDDEYGEGVVRFSGKPSVIIRRFDSLATVHVSKD